MREQAQKFAVDMDLGAIGRGYVLGLVDGIIALRQQLGDAIEDGWGVIANSPGWDDGAAAPEGWREAAERWRDRFIPKLSEVRDAGE